MPCQRGESPNSDTRIGSGSSHFDRLVRFAADSIRTVCRVGIRGGTGDAVEDFFESGGIPKIGSSRGRGRTEANHDGLSVTRRSCAPAYPGARHAPTPGGVHQGGPAAPSGAVSVVSISVLIVNHNGGPLLRECLASVAAFLPRAQVIVVDNASRDGSPELVRTEFPSVQLTTLDTNLGFAAANNIAFAQATGDNLILLNSDASLLPPGLDAALKLLESEPTVAAIAPRIVGADGQPQPSCLPRPSMWRALTRTFWRESTQFALDPRKAIVWLPATCLILRRDALESVGGLFDEQFYVYWEDADLCARLVRQGWRLAVTEEASVLHHGRPSDISPKQVDNPDRLMWYTWGRERWFQKHRSALEARTIRYLDFLYACRLTVRSFFGDRHIRHRARGRAIFEAVRLVVRGQTPERKTDGSAES